MNNFFFTADYTDTGHDDSTLEPEDNQNPPQKRILQKHATTAGMFSKQYLYSLMDIILTIMFF